MKCFRFWLQLILGLSLPVLAFGGQGSDKTGIVKGTITIDGKATSDAVVSVEGLPLEKLRFQITYPIAEQAVMDQRNMKFVPRVLAVLVGKSVHFPNNDNTWHNVFSTSETKKFDLGLYPPGESRSVTFGKPGVVRILCNVHPNMEAYTLIKEHPYFTVPDTQGNYRFDAVPLGRYRVEVWHPELGKKAESFILVRGGEVLVIDVDLNRIR